MLLGVPGSPPITDPRLPPKRTRSKGPFLRQHDLASPVVWPSPTPVRPAACATVWLAPARPAHCAAVGLPAPRGAEPPQLTRLPLPTCRAHCPDGPGRVRASVAAP